MPKYMYSNHILHIPENMLIAKDLDEEKSDQAQEDKENKDATNDVKEADKEDVEDLEKKDGGAKDEDGLTSEGFTEKEETAENETKSEDKEVGRFIISSVNFSLNSFFLRYKSQFSDNHLYLME